MSKKEERHTIINEILEKRGYISIKELTERLNVSEMTIRRDISEFSQPYTVNLINGVIIKENFNYDEKYDINVAGTANERQKDKIGKMAASLVNDGDIIAIDIGSTTEQIAKYLPKSIDITVICYALNVVNHVRNNGITKIVFGGGIFKEKSQSFESEEAIKLIRKYRINKAFISAAGVSPKLGITCANMYEVGLKQTLIKSSLEKILVFDSSKYHVIKPAYFADISEFNTVITDENITAEAVEYLENNDIKVYKV